MSTNEKYVKYELEGTLDLKTIQATIRGKEGQFFEFKENEVVESLTDLQKKTNIVTFRDVSKIPNDLIFQYSVTLSRLEQNRSGRRRGRPGR